MRSRPSKRFSFSDCREHLFSRRTRFYFILFYPRASRNSGVHTGVQMRYQDGVWVKEDYFIFRGIYLLDRRKGSSASFVTGPGIYMARSISAKKPPAACSLVVSLGTDSCHSYYLLSTHFRRDGSSRHMSELYIRPHRASRELTLDPSSDDECGKSGKRMNIIPGRKLDMNIGKKLLHYNTGSLCT